MPDDQKPTEDPQDVLKRHGLEQRPGMPGVTQGMGTGLAGIQGGGCNAALHASLRATHMTCPSCGEQLQ